MWAFDASVEGTKKTNMYCCIFLPRVLRSWLEQITHSDSPATLLTVPPYRRRSRRGSLCHVDSMILPVYCCLRAVLNVGFVARIAAWLLMVELQIVNQRYSNGQQIRCFVTVHDWQDGPRLAVCSYSITTAMLHVQAGYCGALFFLLPRA